MKNRMKERALIIAAILACLLWTCRCAIVFTYILDGEYLTDLGSVPYARWMSKLANLPAFNAKFNTPLDEWDMSIAKAESVWKHRQIQISDKALYAQLTIRIPSEESDSRQKRIEYNRHLLEWLKRGAALDPGNALYNLRMARIYLEDACEYNKYLTFEKHPYTVMRNISLPRSSQMPVIIYDRVMLDVGITEYRKAISKPLRTYQYETVRTLTRHLSRPWVTDQYMHCMFGYFRITGSPYLGQTRAFYGVARLLAQEGDTKTAQELLDINSWLHMRSNELDAPMRRAGIYDYTATLWDIAVDQSNTSDAQKYRGINQAMSRWSPPSTGALDYMNHLPYTSLYAQAEWAYAMNVLIWLVLAALVRELGWSIYRRIARRPSSELSASKAPMTLSTICAGIAVLGCLVSFVLPTTRSGYDNWMVNILPCFGTGLITFCWFVFRHQFKRQCEREGIPVPNRWAELSYNLVTLAVIGLVYYMFYQSALVDHSYDTLAAIGALPLIAIIVFCIWCKFTTPDYYALANRETRRFSSRLVMLIAVSVMPLLLLQEVVLLQVGKSGLPAYKSIDTVIKYDQAITRECVQHVQRVLKDAER
ncbi:MAG: hypothetical protein ACYC1M_13605 [Armatimonadota bacterium]